MAGRSPDWLHPAVIRIQLARTTVRRMIERMNRRDWLFYALMLSGLLPATYHIVNDRAVNGVIIIIFGIGVGSVVRYMMIMDPKRDPDRDEPPFR